MYTLFCCFCHGMSHWAVTCDFQQCGILTSGGRSTLIFFFIRRLGPSIYRSSPKKSGISNTPKNIWNFRTPQKYPPFCTLTLRKDMNPKYSPFCDDLQKISAKSSYLQKYYFSENPKYKCNTEIQNFDPPPPPIRWPESTYVWKYQSTQPGILTWID